MSPGAALAFLHLYLLADDFGNLPANPDTLRTDAFPLRRVTVAQMGGWLRELSDTTLADGTAAPLITTYSVRGELYIHIEQFEETQPAGKNGRRVQRYPLNPGESKGIRVCPVKSGPAQAGVVQKSIPLHSDTQHHTQHQHQHHAEGAGGAGGLVLTPEGEQAAQVFTKPPDWLREGQGWFTLETARELVALGLEPRTYTTALRAAKSRRATLKNPAGWIIGELRKAAQSPGVLGKVGT